MFCSESFLIVVEAEAEAPRKKSERRTWGLLLPLTFETSSAESHVRVLGLTPALKNAENIIMHEQDNNNNTHSRDNSTAHSARHSFDNVRLRRECECSEYSSSTAYREKTSAETKNR